MSIAPTPDGVSSVRDELRCPECSYSLRHLAAPQCPECGLSLAFVDGPYSTIPWGDRRRIGCVRAFAWTVLLACFWPKQLCHEYCRPVSARDAGRFRWLCILVAATVMGLGVSGYGWLRPQDLYDTQQFFGAWFLPCILVSILLGLVVMSGAAGDLFITRRVHPELTRRARALSAYSTAWLCWSWLPLVFFALAPACEALEKRMRLPFDLTGLIAIVGAALVPGIFFCWAIGLMRIARYTVREPRIVTRVAWVTPLIWLASGLLIMVGIPVAGLLAAIVGYTLWN